LDLNDLECVAAGKSRSMGMQPESLKNTGLTFQSFATCGASALTTWQALTSSRAASRARTLATLESRQGLTEPDQDYGLNTSESFASYDPDTCLWRTSQLSLFGGWEPFSETWPRSGMTVSGSAYRQLPLARRIAVTASSLWPTPRSSPNENRQTRPTPSQLTGKHGMNLATAVNLWPTPSASDGNEGKGIRRGVTRTGKLPSGQKAQIDLSQAVKIEARDSGQVATGQLNPTWVEWLMGFPLGWTDLEG
jgi:hypothetical protein